MEAGRGRDEGTQGEYYEWSQRCWKDKSLFTVNGEKSKRENKQKVDLIPVWRSFSLSATLRAPLHPKTLKHTLGEIHYFITMNMGSVVYFQFQHIQTGIFTSCLNNVCYKPQSPGV